MTTPRREPSAKKTQADDKPSNTNRRPNPDEPSSKSPRTTLPSLSRSPSISRFNKLYRSPPTPPAEVQFDREQSFVLDCQAVSNISWDYSTTNPKLGSAIPPYNSQLDPHVDGYFNYFGVQKTLEKSRQVGSISIIIIIFINFDAVFHVI